MNPTQRDSELVVELAKTFITMMENRFSGWSRAFFRFSADEQQYGSNGSFERDGEVSLFSALALSEFFDHMNGMAHELWRGGPKFQVMLLTIHSDFDYRVDFEPLDAARWSISKFDRASGLPAGLA
ncbi:hypothetical protein V9K97_26720 [Variovorax sp. CCNWLW186]|uniref:hypothetical protein n=1 Tax=Variovorax sp. CCNWLW186 TaxID=3127473 RepID=UPI003076E0F0